MSVAEVAPDALAHAPDDGAVAPDRVTSLTTWLLRVIVVIGLAFRLRWITRNGSSFDESFTAMIGRHSLGGIFDALRAGDSHPPLDYLLRAPFARAGAGDLVMRFPSFLFASAALILFAWWMRTRGVAGIVAVALMAVSPFQIMYGGEARMYALLELVGVAAAVIAERWLREPRPWHATVAGALVLVAVFDHVSGWLLALGLLVLGGLRRDDDARRWRLAIVIPLGIWAVVWGSSFLVQAGVTHASWIDRTSFRSLAEAVSGQLTTQGGVALLVASLVVVGVGAVVATAPGLGRVVLCCGVVPFAAAAIIGVFVPFFIDRTVTIAAWAPCVAVGYAVAGVWRWSRPMGVAALVLVAALVVPATVVFLDRRWEYDASIDHLLAVARRGDVVATVPAWYGPLIDWRVGARAVGAERPVHLGTVPDSHAIVIGTRATTGKVWVLSFAGDRRNFPGFTHCAADWTDGVTDVSCIETHSSG